jgi:hypothetical protein
MSNTKYLELKKEFDKVLMLTNTKIYLMSYFSELRSEIDILFAKKRKQTQSLMELNLNWTKMIDKVNTFEKECVNKDENEIDSKLDFKLNERLNFIKLKLNELKKVIELLNKQRNIIIDTDGNEALKKRNELFFEIECILSDTKNKMENILFMNKTILFLSKKNCDFSEIFKELNPDTMVGKLIIVTNQYFNSFDIDTIKR